MSWAEIVAWLRSIFSPDYSREWLSGALGIFGALVGSAVTILWTELYNGRTQKRQDRERLAVGAFLLWHRIFHIYTVATNVRSHFRERLADAEERKVPFRCIAVQGVTKIAPVVFTSEELWSMRQLGGGPLLNAASALDRSYNSVAGVLDDYRERREALWSTLTPHTMRDMIGSVSLSPGEIQKMTPKLAVLDNLLEQIMPELEQNVRKGFEALSIIVAARGKPLGRDFGCHMPDPEGKVVWVGMSPEMKARRLSERAKVVFRKLLRQPS